MPEVYLPLDVDFDEDEKVARLARFTKQGEARALRDLLVSMWRYCKRNRTDGHVPREQVGKLVYPDSPRIGLRDADRLVEVGLAERTDDGYYFPTYLKRNKSREQLEAEAKVKAEAGRKGGRRSGLVRAVEADSQAETKQGASPLLRTSEARDRDRDRDKKLLGPDKPAEVVPLPSGRPPDDLWDAIVEVCGIDPKMTKTQATLIGKVRRELAEVDATPGQVRVRANRWRQRYRDTPLTAPTLAKHWASLGEANHARNDNDPMGWAR